MKTILPFASISLNDITQVGGKNASLGEMIQHLTGLGIKVPNGFATTAAAYWHFLAENQLREKINQLLATLDKDDLKQLHKVSKTIQSWILAASLSEQLIADITSHYEALNKKQDPQQSLSFAVRSSATAEDLPHASFAGQQETYLNVQGIDAILTAVKKVYASLFTERAITYRIHQGFAHDKVAISAGIQRMVRSDCAASGVIFTLDTESGFNDVIFITAAYGLGETIVQGAVNPDEFYVHKPMLRADKAAIISRKLGDKAIKMIYADNKNQTLQTTKVEPKDQSQFCLTDNEILTLAKQALLIEEHYQTPMDIEWAKDGMDGQLYIVQARPETVKSQQSHQVIESFKLTQPAPEPKVIGRSIGERIGQGQARLIKSTQSMHELKPGEILITDMTDPDWEPIMKQAAAIVTNRGGRTCHAAIVARELGIPAVVGCGNATSQLVQNEPLTVSCAEGEQGFVYPGLLDFSVDRNEISKLPEIPLKLSMNLANPGQAFYYQFLPNDGVGLTRLEFIISNQIGIHPNALLRLNELPNELKAQIENKTSAYASPVEFYVERLREGIATIAAAFYPKPIIVRFSDFKSNEYANLLGGRQFEPQEDNPMLGYRGACRYNHADFRDCFALECEAIRRAREETGLINTHIMFPFVRTVDEAKSLLALLPDYGLIRKPDGLQVYMMCEIPSNAILADEFLEHFDGFSIGSNDLTQLTLGLDRDSELIADLFDERDLAVKKLLQLAITACRKQNKYVGICGQGPSDHPDLAQWLMEQGITSLSLNPDSMVSTWIALSKIK